MTGVFHPGLIRGGIAAGDAAVGGAVSEQIRAHAAIKDAVDLASRPEGKTNDPGDVVALDEAGAVACAAAPCGRWVRATSMAVRVFTLGGPGVD